MCELKDQPGYDARLRVGPNTSTALGPNRSIVFRCRRIGATGKITIRFDSGYQSDATLKELERLDISYTMAVRANAKGIKLLVEAIDSDSWTPIDYAENGEAQVANNFSNLIWLQCPTSFSCLVFHLCLPSSRKRCPRVSADSSRWSRVTRIVGLGI